MIIMYIVLAMQDHSTENKENTLGPVNTRNLLTCFLWVIKNIDPDLISNWWHILSITKRHVFFDVLDLCVLCFEYRVRNLCCLDIFLLVFSTG